MTVPAVWDISIRNRRTNVWIHASEDEWCKRQEIEPGRVWKYGFEYFKPPTPMGIRPDRDYDEPILKITKTNQSLDILIEDFGGVYTVDVYIFGELLWADVGGPTRRHVGAIKTVDIPAVPPPVRPPPVRPPVIPEVFELGERTIRTLTEEIASRLAARLVQLPNRLDRIEIDTSVTDWVSLKKTGKIKPAVALGFWVESIGGGFEYRIIRKEFGPTKPRTATADDKWDIEFDDLLVRGLGTTGIGVILYWWRE